MNYLINDAPEQIAAQRFTKNLVHQGYEKQALHVYQDTHGQPVYWRIRLKHPVTGEKWLRPLSQDKQGHFVLKEPEFSQGKPLYQLPSLLHRSEEIVWIVEGELCADMLTKINILATTSGSMDSVSVTDWRPLAKRKVVIWPDNDEPGLKYAQDVTQKLQSLGCAVEWVDISQLQLPPKGDCVDWLNQHPQASTQDILLLPMTLPIQSKKLSANHDQQSGQKLTESKKNQRYSAHSHLFKVSSQGVFYLAEEETLWICSRLEVKALIRDKSSENWGRLLEFYDADGQLHIWSMPMEMLKGSGEEIKGELLRLGLEIAAGNKVRNLLMAYILSTNPEARARCINRTGWHDGLFVFPNQTIGNKDEFVFFQAEVQSKDYQQSGTLEEWREQVATLCCGNSRLIFAVATAFAAMLLYPSGMESGGIHFVGESSSGKTTVLRVAASVFGGINYLNRWRGTINGLEALASLRSDTLLILDELSQIDAKEAGEIAYMLANGSGKIRAAKNGGSRHRHDWRLLFLSAGEVGLAQHMLEADKKIRAGQEVRLVDIPAETGKGLGVFENLHSFGSAAAFSNALVRLSATYYGSAAISFLKKVTQPEYLVRVPILIKVLCEDFLAKNLPKESSGQVYRVCERFGLIAAAGELASEFNITGWAEGEAKKAASACFHDWLASRGGTGNQENTRILSQVKSFFEAHAESRFSHWQAESSRTINRAGFRKTFDQKTQFYVLPEVFRHEICVGWDFQTVTKLLLSEGWIESDNHGKPYRREYLPGIGRSRCYVFTNKIWE